MPHQTVIAMVSRILKMIQKIVTVIAAVLPKAHRPATKRELALLSQSAAKRSGLEQLSWLRNVARSRSN